MLFGNNYIICTYNIMDILDFFPVHEKQHLGRLPNKLIKDTIFGKDNMTNLANNGLEVENVFPWSLQQKTINEIVEPYLKNDFISIIEVGTHIGTTATRFANAIKTNPDSYVLCIDTWLTDVSEYILRKDSLNVNLRPGNDHVLFDLFIQKYKKQFIRKHNYTISITKHAGWTNSIFLWIKI